MACRFVVAAVALVAIGSARAAPPPGAQRVRGTILAFDATSLSVRGADEVTKLKIGAGAKYASIVKSALKAIQPGSFIGTATKGYGAHMTALEVVVFPPEMRGTGEGHYGWDRLPDAGGGTVASAMTNGTVQAGGTKMVASSMTNGNIDSAASKDGALHIAVSYKGGTQDIVVPADAPVVAFKLAGPEIVKIGAQIFIAAVPGNGGLEAKFIAVGQDGIKPPM